METVKLKGNTFEKTMREVRQGHALGEASEKLTELVKQVRANGRCGELVIRLKVKPASRGETTTLMVEDEIVVKLPKAERPQTVFFASDENLLQRNDPRQPEFEQLKVVEGAGGSAPVAEQLKKVG